MNSADVRARLLDTLRLDLVGPLPDDADHADEVLPMAPSKWYLNGFLVPYEAANSQRGDDASDEGMDTIARQTPGDDESVPDAASARKAWFPSSMGMSVLVPAGVRALHAEVTWGDYAPEDPDEDDVVAGDVDRAAAKGRWRRTPCEVVTQVPVDKPSAEVHLKPAHPNVKLVVSAREVRGTEGVPAGTRAVSVFVVNHRPPVGDSVRERSWMFQVRLRLVSEAPFEPRPDVRGRDMDDPDERIADLQYRRAFEYAVGHNVATHAEGAEVGRCLAVHTTWTPVAEVERVVPRELHDVELSMEALGAAASGEALEAKLGPLVTAYADWIVQQRKVDVGGRRKDVARDLMDRAEAAKRRIAAGIALLTRDVQAFEAFKIANRVVATQQRQRFTHKDADTLKPEMARTPTWYPFQLAFILMNLDGISDPGHADRGFVDLLFFPTGGGKTEAYLGLAAFTLGLRRIRNPGLQGAGLSVLMRYTLRLLTLDQLGRAATLLCALETERQRSPNLGTWPFEIGLWVGQTATPNRMGKQGDKDENTARARTLAFHADDRQNPAPIPIESCPWCGRKFRKDCFRLEPDANRPTQLRIRCWHRSCPYWRQDLPILTVDENIYRRLPAFLIATVDKFASLPWVGDTGALFGKVERADASGFYGPMAPGVGNKLPGPLPPPDLIIQDELHLISGPLGTMVGLYETAIDRLSSRGEGAATVRPKIIASTATVRRASSQIQALFGRSDVDVFPPPGPDRRDSFFAVTRSVEEQPARTYVGIAAPGRSLKVVLLRVSLALMGAAQRAWVDAGGDKNADNPADPYMTVLGYFNSLRELGGSRRIVEDEVTAALPGLGDARRRVGKKAPFANRHIHEPLELTSRVSTAKVAEAKERLALGHSQSGHVDYALATNMISVGLDITRLGLMVVLGQPKMTAEYIQATSRVGRDPKKPGLVVSLLNVHRPRDRSHYERFEAWHESFYRQVEATSVTPFSPRALDRGLAAVIVALARLGERELTAPARAGALPTHHAAVEWTAEVVSRRAEGHAKGEGAEELRQRVRTRARDLLDAWDRIAHSTDGVLQYAKEVGQAPPLLHEPLDPELRRKPKEHSHFKASRSLRDVEPTVNLWIRTPDDLDLEERR